MITIQDTGDLQGRRQISIDQMGDEDKCRFVAKLATSDLSPQFLSNPGRQQVNLKVIDLDENNVSLEPNSIIIPLVLTSVTRVDDNNSRCYYRNRFDGNKSTISPSADIDCFVMRDNGETDTLKNPYLLLVFSTVDQSTETGDGERQHFAGQGTGIGQDLDTRPAREHVSRGENANGGLDLKAGEQKSDVAEEQRHEQEKQPEPSVV